MKRARGGAVAVEFAITLPVLMVLLVGVIEWGWHLHRRVAVVQAVRDGALAGCVVQDPTEAESIAVERTEAALDAAGFTSADATVEANSSVEATGDVITVSASVPYTSIFKLVPVSDTLVAESTFRLVVQ